MSSSRANLRLSILLFSAVLPTAFSLASIETEEEELQGYNAIVEDLNKKVSPTLNRNLIRSQTRLDLQPHSFDDVWIHAGIALLQNTEEVNLDSSKNAAFSARGIQASLGIDILSTALTAEGTVRSFSEVTDGATAMSLKEFDLKVWYKSRLTQVYGNPMYAKLGGGIAARYLTLRTDKQLIDTTTPSSIVSAGCDYYLNDNLSLGAEIAYRNALISETNDKSSLDFAFRIDTHF